MLFQKGQTALRLFTTIATLGTPRDVTLQELRVESFFPIVQRPGTTRTLRGAAIQIAGAETTQHPIARKNASL